MLAYTSALASEYAPNDQKLSGLVLLCLDIQLEQSFADYSPYISHPYTDGKAFSCVSGLLILLTPALLFLFLPERIIGFPLTKRPKNALEKANRILRQMKLSSLQIYQPGNKAVKNSTFFFIWKTIKKGYDFIVDCIFSFFYCTLFSDQLDTKAGNRCRTVAVFSDISGLLFNLGAFAGIIIQGYLSARFGLRKVICSFLLLRPW